VLLIYRLLDIVDARKSALVIAPTSSGKTFVSFYIMKLVLEERSSLGLKEMAQFRAENPGREFPAHQYPGVVLYVGPNKYLVRQVWDWWLLCAVYRLVWLCCVV
jgi:Lhr-like helicase